MGHSLGDALCSHYTRGPAGGGLIFEVRCYSVRRIAMWGVAVTLSLLLLHQSQHWNAGANNPGISSFTARRSVVKLILTAEVSPPGPLLFQSGAGGRLGFPRAAFAWCSNEVPGIARTAGRRPVRAGRPGWRGGVARGPPWGGAAPTHQPPGHARQAPRSAPRDPRSDSTPCRASRVSGRGLLPVP